MPSFSFVGFRLCALHVMPNHLNKPLPIVSLNEDVSTVQQLDFWSTHAALTNLSYLDPDPRPVLYA